MGQCNIFYLRDKHGLELNLPWTVDILDYVETHRSESLIEPDSVSSDVAAEIEEDRKANFASNPLVRKMIEMRAMDVVRKEYKSRGIELEDRSANNPYDFSYMDGSVERHIEVKGTRALLSSFILTANEVSFARDHPGETELCIVHSIEVEGSVNPIARGGILHILHSWNPDEHELLPTQYCCKLDPSLTQSPTMPPV